jgi:hypothetical protein
MEAMPLENNEFNDPRFKGWESKSNSLVQWNAPKTQIFQCTRHATSCNNIDMGQDFFGKDEDPSLTMYGVEQAIILAKTSREINNQRDRFTPPPFPIAVSGLIRTWETAVLLYGYQESQPFNKNKSRAGYIELKLRICPWLRETSEYGKLFDVGNRPQPLRDSIPKFIKFLNKLMESDFETRNYRISKITIYILPEIPENSDGLHPELRGMTWREIEIKLNENNMTYIKPRFCGEDSVYGDEDGDPKAYGYREEAGDILKFMKWYTDEFLYSPSTVHIVAHNTIMQEFVKDNLHRTLDKDIPEENCWTITMPYRDTYDNPNEVTKIMNNIKHGFKKPKSEMLKQAKQSEKNQGEKSLCGEYGEVRNEEKLSCSYGGRRTRRKRNRRKKTRRYRR